MPPDKAIRAIFSSLFSEVKMKLLLAIVALCCCAGCWSNAGICKGEKEGQYFIAKNSYMASKVVEYKVNPETGNWEYVRTVR